MKTFLQIITNPISFITKFSISDKLIKFVEKRPWIIFIIAAVLVIIYIFFRYIFPTFQVGEQ
jgi:hypothetical protein